MTIGVIAVVLIGIGTSVSTWAAESVPVTAGDKVAGATVWKEHCSACHDNPTDRVPPRAVLVYKTPKSVIYTLTKGVMRINASMLSPKEVADVAAYLYGLGPLPDLPVEVDVHANMCKNPAPKMELSDADWNGWGADTKNSRLNTHPGFTADDVPKLKLKWAFAYSAQPGFQPIAAGGRVFATSRDGEVFSLDPHTGCTYWVTDVSVMVRTAPMVGALPKGSKAKFAVYFATHDNHMHALDAETGKELWDTLIGDNPMQQITASAVLYNGRIYQGMASLDEVAIRDPKFVCCKISGMLVAVNAVTGKVIWKARTVAQQPKEIGTNAAGTIVFGPGGASIWATPVVDPVRKAVYAATSNSNSPISIPESNSVMAFDMNTGKRLWITQLTADDNFCPRGWTGVGSCNTREDDMVGGVILHTLPDGKRVVLASSKSEEYGLDPDSKGKLLWRIKSHDRGGTGRWGFAIDSTYVYVNSSAAIPAQGRGGGGRNAGPGGGGGGGGREGAPRPPGPTSLPGGIAALDPATGTIAWFTKPTEPTCSWTMPEGVNDCNSSQPAGLAAIPGVVFAGSADGHTRAYETATGNVVWDFDTGKSWDGVNGAPAVGGGMNYGTNAIAYGMLFVNSGAPGMHQGNALLAFSVDGK